MAITRPSGEQLRFESTNTGSHVLDTYLEQAEIGGRSLADLFGELFDTAGTLDPNIFQFRVDTSTFKLQVRIGTYIGTNAGWVDVPDGTFFRPTGNYQVGFDYLIHDLFNYNDNLYMVTAAHTSGAVPDTNSTFVAVSGGTGKVPATATQLAGSRGKFLQVNQAQTGYELTSFADSNVLFGLQQNGNTIEVVESGLVEELQEGALVQSLVNYTKSVSDPLVSDGFWDRTFSSGGITYKYFDADADQGVLDNDDLQAFANIINGSTTSGTYYTNWVSTIRPYIITNKTTRNYDTMLIPAGSGTTYKMFDKVRDTSSTSIDPSVYATWFLGNGSTQLSVSDNKLVITI